MCAESGRSYVQECACKKMKRARANIERSGLADTLEELTFDRYKDAAEWQKNAKEKARAYASSIIGGTYTGKKPWFFIGGNVGSGKTHLCTAICGELLNNNHAVTYMQWLTDARTLKAHVKDADFESLVSRFVDAPVLYIDDLFKQQNRGNLTPTDADVRIAFEIINRRYIKNLPTVISSEWFLSELLGVDAGTFSRVVERAKDYAVKIGRDPSRNWRIRQ